MRPHGVDKCGPVASHEEAYDQAVKQKDMETIGKIESLVMDMFQSTMDAMI